MVHEFNVATPGFSNLIVRKLFIFLTYYEIFEITDLLKINENCYKQKKSTFYGLHEWRICTMYLPLELFISFQ